MFDHVKFGVSDFAASKAFFLKALGSRRIFTWRSWPRIAGKSKLSIARLWRRVPRTMVRLVCARTTTRTTMQLSSLVRTGTTSKWFATSPRPKVGRIEMNAPHSSVEEVLQGYS
jgi:hypothetical protein